MSRIALLALLAAAVGAQEPAARRPILVELFTSEGCSSCPPADRMLKQLDPQVVVLSEHVDYWNRLGWKDPYSSHEMTERQENYGRQFGLDGVYTPQMVIDGQTEFVGNDAPRALTELRRAVSHAKVEIQLVRTASGVHLSFRDAPQAAEVFLVRARDTAASNVSGGENKGRNLAHVAVAESIRRVAKVSRGGSVDQTVDLPDAARAERLIVFLQQGGQGKVFGAAMLGPA